MNLRTEDRHYFSIKMSRRLYQWNYLVLDFSWCTDVFDYSFNLLNNYWIVQILDFSWSGVGSWYVSRNLSNSLRYLFCWHNYLYGPSMILVSLISILISPLSLFSLFSFLFDFFQLNALQVCLSFLRS